MSRVFNPNEESLLERCIAQRGITGTAKALHTTVGTVRTWISRQAVSRRYIGQFATLTGISPLQAAALAADPKPLPITTVKEVYSEALLDSLLDILKGEEPPENVAKGHTDYTLHQITTLLRVHKQNLPHLAHWMKKYKAREATGRSEERRVGKEC